MIDFLKFLGKIDKAFRLLNFNGIEPIEKADFAELVKVGLLVKGTEQAAMDFFKELDKDKNEKLSLTDLLETAGAENSSKKNKDFIEAVLAKEQDLTSYKRNKLYKAKNGKPKFFIFSLNRFLSSMGKSILIVGI